MVESKTIKGVLEELGYRPKLLNGEYRVPALFRNGDHPSAISINGSTGKWYDHVELRGGEFETFVKLHGQEPGQIDFGSKPQKIERPTIFKPSALDLLFPQDKFYNDRGISSETLRLFKGGVCHSGKLYNRWTFPIFGQDGKIYGFSGRLLKWDQSSKAPKWKHLGEKKFWVYPIHLTESYIKQKAAAILVESIGDILALWEAGVRNTLFLAGLNLHPKMLSYLLSLDLKKVYVSLNNDESERGQKAAAKIEKKLRKFFDPQRIELAFPPEKDWGETPRAKIREFWA